MTHKPASFLLLLLVAATALADPRARDLGVPFDGTPGPLNAITDVPGVEVGHSTIIEGSGALRPGIGPIRTGVTIILPRGKNVGAPVFAGTFALNGTGELTGSTFIEEYGLVEGPIALTNSQSVGTVRDAVAAWLTQEKKWELCCLPVVGETWDGELNDINGFHVHANHVTAAIRSATAGAVAEGNVGGGTGMVAYGYKSGIGTASRVVEWKSERFSVGVLVQANMGRRGQLVVAGVPAGRELMQPQTKTSARRQDQDSGSILIIVATDAPLLPHQLKRVAKRAAMGLARTGSTSGDSSGDIIVAFSTANPKLLGLQNGDAGEIQSLRMLANSELGPVFAATVESTEEAIINGLVAARTMTGINDQTIEALPHAALRQLLETYNRLHRQR